MKTFDYSWSLRFKSKVPLHILQNSQLGDPVFLGQVDIILSYGKNNLMAGGDDLKFVYVYSTVCAVQQRCQDMQL